MADKTITLGYNTRATRGFTLFDSFGDPVDITGYTFALSVKRSADDADTLLMFTPLAGTLDADPTTGRLTFTFSPLETALPPGTYVGKINWWSGAVSSTPTDGWTVDFIITPQVDRAFV